MIYRELEKAMSGSDAKMDTDIIISIGDNQYKVSSAEFDPETKTFVIKSDDTVKLNRYSIEYEIYRDHNLIDIYKLAINEASDIDVIIKLNDLGYDVLKQYGIIGELQDKTGSIKVETEVIEHVKADNVKENAEPKKETHFYSFKAREVMRFLDEEHDIYIRVWKNGKIA